MFDFLKMIGLAILLGIGGLFSRRPKVRPEDRKVDHHGR